MTLGLLAATGALLSMERACYVWIARAPAAFRAWCARPAAAWLGEPVAAVEKLFYGFKALQAAVFVAWCAVHGEGSLVPAAPPALLAVAGAAALAGQALNLSVFWRLGRVAVFFGDRFGHAVPWCRRFPFSLVAHPQYVGAVVTIWAFFFAMRFPHDDWYLVPVLETAYYAAGAVLEARRAGEAAPRGRPATQP